MSRTRTRFRLPESRSPGGAISTAAARAQAAAVLMATFPAALGCSSGPAFDGHVYHKGEVHFEVGDAPPTWKRIELAGAEIAYRDNEHDASIVVNGRCGVKADDAPLEALTNHLLIGTTDREFISEETTPFDGREARRTVLRAKLDGVPMMISTVVLKKDGCLYDFVRVAPPQHFEAGTPAFQEFVAHFRTIGTR